MNRYVALLRAINVGGRNSLSTADMKAICAGIGGTGIRTCIQSGNLVFAHGDQPPAVAAALAAAIAAHAGVRVPVIVLTPDELAAAIADNPFLAAGRAPETVHYAFLADMPTKAALARLDPHRSPGDAFAIGNRVIWLHLPNGVAGTRLTNAWLDSSLATASTIRNSRTVQKLAQLANL